MKSGDNVSIWKLNGSTNRSKCHFPNGRKLLLGEGWGSNDVRYMELSFNMRLQAWLPSQGHLQWISTRIILCDPNAFYCFANSDKTIGRGSNQRDRSGCSFLTDPCAWILHFNSALHGVGLYLCRRASEFVFAALFPSFLFCTSFPHFPALSSSALPSIHFTLLRMLRSNVNIS